MRYTAEMIIETLQRHWALAAACVVGLAVALFVIFRAAQDSRRGRLAAALGRLREREAALGKASKIVEKASKRLETLEKNIDRVPPNKLLGGKDALQAAQETEALLRDQVLVVRNEARTIILEDYPPARHAAMRRKYLGEST